MYIRVWAQYLVAAAVASPVLWRCQAALQWRIIAWSLSLPCLCCVCVQIIRALRTWPYAHKGMEYINSISLSLYAHGDESDTIFEFLYLLVLTAILIK